MRDKQNAWRLGLTLISRVRIWETSLFILSNHCFTEQIPGKLGFTANCITPLQNWNYNRTYHGLAWKAVNMLNMKKKWSSRWQNTQTLPENKSLHILSKSTPHENKVAVVKLATLFLVDNIIPCLLPKHQFKFTWNLCSKNAPKCPGKGLFKTWQAVYNHLLPQMTIWRKALHKY